MVPELRHAFRLLWKAPAFTLAAVLTLALGIGGNVAVFTFVDAVLFRPLPFRDPDRLVALSESHVESGQTKVGVLPGSLLDWRERSRSFESLSLVAPATLLVTDRDEPIRLASASVSPEFFAVLGASPVLGRTSFSSTGNPETAREIVISHGLWQRWFGGSPDVLERTIQVQGGIELTILGVMPATFNYPRGADVWHGQPWDLAWGRGDRWRGAIGRLKPGVPLDDASGELRRIAAQLATEFPETNGGWTPDVDPLATAIVGAVRPPLASMLAAVALVFLIACVNVATLVLQRGIGRRRELAMRAALGATRPRLLRQSVVEHGMLAGLGAALGALVAMFVVDGLVALAPPEIPRLETIAIDFRVLTYLAALAIVTTVIIGVVPALRSSRTDATTLLRAGGGTARQGLGARSLVALELALAVVLLVGAGLMVRTMVHLQRVDIGFDPAGVASAELSLPLTRMIDGPLKVGARPAWDRLALFYTDLVEQVAAVPGVERAALVSAPELAGRDGAWFARAGPVEPRADGSPGWRPIQRRVVTPAYFDVLRLPLVRGRAFTGEDHALEYLRTGTGRRRGVAIVNERVARQFWPGEDPIGRILTIDGDMRVDGRTVVGIAGDARDLAPDVAPPPIIYVPFAESPAYSATLLVRSAGPEAPVADIRARLRALDAALLIGEVRQLETSYAAALAPRRFITVVLTAFAAVGLLVAGVGLYGLVAMSVAGRTRELGIRIALGASWAGIRRMVLGEAALVVGIGTIAGAVAAAAATRVLQTQLVGVDALDTATWMATGAILCAAGLAAAWVPARRAARIDPIEALRQE
jgi:putative ABC transport system permease protein